MAIMRELVDAYFKEHGLIDHQIESYNDFVENRLQKIIDEVGYIETEITGGYKVKLGKIKVGKPVIKEADGSIRPITPMEARIRDLTYSVPLYLEMTPIIGEGEDAREGETVEVYIGELPVMLGSKICHLYGKSREELIDLGEDPEDPFGYFIINGTEKVLITQEDLIPNRILCEKAERSGKIVDVAKVFSTRHGFRALCTVERHPDGLLYATFPGMPGQIPLVILMKALGAETDKDIIESIDDERFFMEIVLNIQEIREEHNINSPEDALEFIGKRVAPGQAKDYRLKRAETVLCNYLLPHLGVTKEDFPKKIRFLGIMARNALELYFGYRGEDDKDHYAYKRAKLAGDLMEDLFRYAFSQLVKDIKYQLERQTLRNKTPSIQAAVRSDILTERIKHAMATGTWVGGKTGVSQLLDRTSYLATNSQLRRIVSPLSRSQPHFEARELHGTHWGKICPSETPEGPNCGLVKNFAIMCKVTREEDDSKVIELLKSFGINVS
ncbi:DNA-directed RNA polymerase, subunit B'' (rpoB2) [Methanocaldococcus jannaschii DSM 2661]|uniref:DNA-directed RNA polymerase subunit Rpo2N n=2 Tax=Methanocaldococcus jannaschii TaxID=2190 RepID=RPO2N_METJA|nr:RecName: Full=DNA-directed RNA polymerase subunit Rpo2N; AltName: Full=DNA-directed RNA polymerase subunit B'' [Methanocaldococcus jannaschii DSM 2661]AAB99043.1 DNA-directed RNA polymerase, subunit B'' (rpoB2) [Methanocaldococcus jannaschii DSM 2661]